MTFAHLEWRRSNGPGGSVAGVELIDASTARANRAAFHSNRSHDGAKDLFLESPYITFRFINDCTKPLARGVDFKIVTPDANNWRLFFKLCALEVSPTRSICACITGHDPLKAMLIYDHI